MSQTAAMVLAAAISLVFALLGMLVTRMQMVAATREAARRDRADHVQRERRAEWEAWEMAAVDAGPEHQRWLAEQRELCTVGRVPPFPTTGGPPPRHADPNLLVMTWR